MGKRRKEEDIDTLLSDSGCLYQRSGGNPDSQSSEPRGRGGATGAIEALGGTYHGSWMAFGEYDAIVIAEMPDNVRAAGVAMAFAGGGALKDVKTTPLLTWEEGVEAMRLAGESGYRVPS